MTADVINYDPIRGTCLCRLGERSPEDEDKLTTCGYTFTFLFGTESMGDPVCEGTDKGTGKPVNDSSEDGDRWDMLSEAAGASDIGPIASPRERELSAEGLDRSPASDGDKLGEIPSGASSHQVCLQGSPSLDKAEKVGSVGSPLGTPEPKETQGDRKRLWIRSGNDLLWTSASLLPSRSAQARRCLRRNSAMSWSRRTPIMAGLILTVLSARKRLMNRLKRNFLTSLRIGQDASKPHVQIILRTHKPVPKQCKQTKHLACLLTHRRNLAALD